MTEIINPYKKYSKGKTTKEEVTPREEAEKLAGQKLGEKEFKRQYHSDFNKEAGSSPTIVLPSTQHIKLSVRLPKGIVTSLTIKKNIIALWLLYTSDPSYIDIDSINKWVEQSLNGVSNQAGNTGNNDIDTIMKPKEIEDALEADLAAVAEAKKELEKIQEKINRSINNFVHKCIGKWIKESGKGLSDFVTEMMIEDLLEDYKLYTIVLTQIK